MRFPRSVEAARGVGMEKKALAEALYEEVPPRRGRPAAGTDTIEEQLTSAAGEIFEETGETYSWQTLKDYRNVAAWVAGNGGVHTPIRWAEASWTAHLEAYKKGETFERFAGDPVTKRKVRQRNGGATGDVPAAARAINANPAEAEKLVMDMTPAAIEAVAKAALDRHPRLQEPPSTPEGRKARERLAAQNDATESLTLKILQACVLMEQAQVGWEEHYATLGPEERKEVDHALQEIYVIAGSLQMNAVLDQRAGKEG